MDVKRISLQLLVNISVQIAAINEVCYHEFDIGCFKLDPPWTRLAPAPQSPEKIRPAFYLLTRNTFDDKNSKHDEWRLICTNFYRPSIVNLQRMDYQSSRKATVFLLHGMYVSSVWNWSMLRKQAKAYLSKRDVNLIIVRYRAGANIIYPRLVANIRVVGAVIAKFIEKLMELVDLKTDEIHMIGHSLGGHLAGYVGKLIPNINRITGLDIAGPYFRGADPMYRLHSDDAQHIDVHHTNGGAILGLGYAPPIGQVDFYFNGGSNQASECVASFFGILKQFSQFKIIRALAKGYLLGACSHLKAIEYWLESLENAECTMWGTTESLDSSQFRSLFDIGQQKRLTHDCTKDQSCAPVGLDTFAYVKSGTFYVRTKMSSPYCVQSSHITTANKRNAGVDMQFILSQFS